MAHDLMQLRALVRNCDWEHAQAAWEHFAADLSAHLAFEEHECFAFLARSGDDGPACVERLQVQHGTIRDELATLTADFTRRELASNRIDAFRDMLRDHAQEESEFLYPQLRSRGPRPDFR